MPDTMFLPGFVNAHCHMDLSHLRKKVPFTGSFAEWIRDVVALREQLTKDDVLRAATELQQSGVTSLYDHVGASSELSYIMDTPFRKRLFFEVIGVTPEMALENCRHQQERALIARSKGVAASPTPHATYSVHPEAWKKMEGDFSIHCAESAEEWEMFTEGRGNLWEFVRERASAGHPEAKPKDLNCEILRAARNDKCSPLRYLATHDLLPTRPWLAVHCNTLTDDDMMLLKNSRATVVHCPRSHRFFNHPPFPLERLRAAGVPIAIGTDSLASCPNFDFLAELRTMREEFPFLTTEEILKMATQRDRLAPDDTDDIIGLPVQDDILKGPVTFCRIGGRRVI